MLAQITGLAKSQASHCRHMRRSSLFFSNISQHDKTTLTAPLLTPCPEHLIFTLQSYFRTECGWHVPFTHTWKSRGKKILLDTFPSLFVMLAITLKKILRFKQ